MVYRSPDDEDVGDITTGSRACRKCKQRKPMADFHLTTSGNHRRRLCKACVQERAMEVRRGTPEKYARAARNRAIKRKYGLTPAAFERQLIEQNYRCAICWGQLTRPSTHVDHDHATGAFRGLLCHNCNMGLGHFRDDVLSLTNAIRYIKRGGFATAEKEETN